MLSNTFAQLPTPSDTPTRTEKHVQQLPTSHSHYSTTWTPSDSTTPISTNPSRKRSRDETAFEPDGENSYFSFPSVQQLSTPAPIPEEPIYGEGMILINPQTGRVLPAESQTGTWYEEKEAEEASKRTQDPSKPEFRPTMPVGRKSMRLSQSSIRATLEPIHADVPASPPKSSPHVEVDEATMALGIGWTKMSSEDPDLQAAARGWAKYLENHYSHCIHGAEILLKNRGLDAYLVGSQEGFFLFTEDLLRGQLVGTTWDICLNNLRSQPMAFEGNDVLLAQRTPAPDGAHESKGFINNWADYDRLNNRSHTKHEVNGANTGKMDLD